MALTRDRATAYREGIEIEYPVAAVKIYAGGMVCINAAGYAVPAADTVNFKLGGIALEQVDNSAGSPGDKTIRVRRVGVFELKALSIAQTDVGKQMYVVDDETFDETNPGQGIICGVLTKFVSATRGWLDIGSGVKPTLAAASGDALTVSDTGDHFGAAVDTVPEQIQDLAKGPFFLTLPRFTGWVKDGTAKVIATLPAVESGVPLMIKRAYASVLTAPGATKTLALTVNGSALVSIVTTATLGEAETLSIPIAPDTDIVISANETADGAAANCDVILVLYKDDGE
ncbi:MAG: hypothetical protein V1742_09870 [Pseudomonadota bacterium]